MAELHRGDRSACRRPSADGLRGAPGRLLSVVLGAVERHLLTGDFNAVAPGDRASLAGAPLWVRAQTWFQVGRVPRRALGPLLDAGYVDCFRETRPQEDGFTLPSSGPRV